MSCKKLLKGESLLQPFASSRFVRFIHLLQSIDQNATSSNKIKLLLLIYDYYFCLLLLINNKIDNNRGDWGKLSTLFEWLQFEEIWLNLYETVIQ